MKTRAYAKINWTLFVTGRRKDGYHSLDTVMQRIDLFNEITIKPSAEWIVSSADGSLPTDGTNLTLKAAIAYMNAINCSDKYALVIERNIPAGSGLGGGSADAAAVLSFLNQRYGRLTPNELSKIGLSLGADVPYCLTEKPARCTGLGEIINPIENAGKYYLLLAAPNVELSTVGVFERHDQLEGDKLVELKNNLPYLDKLSNNMSDFIAVFGNNDSVALSKALKRFYCANQLIDAAVSIAPVISSVLESIKSSGALFTSMSGSGSCCFGLYESLEAANKAKSLVDTPFKAVVSTI